MNGIFHGMVLPQAAFPFSPPRLYVVGDIEASKSEIGAHELAFRWMSPDGAVLSELNGAINVVERSQSAEIISVNVILEFQNPKLETPGEYRATISVDDVELGSESLMVYPKND